MNVEFRTGKMDAADYHFLRTAVGWSSYATQEIEQGLENTLFTVTAFLENKAIGMGRVVGDGKLVFYIQDVIVLPEFQNKGIGKRIMEELLKYIDARSVNNSVIGLMSAVGKDGFYEKFGFVRRPNERMGSGMNIWVAKNR